MDRDAHAVGVELGEAGEERRRVPVGSHAVDRDVEQGHGTWRALYDRWLRDIPGSNPVLPPAHYDG